ncbi:eukaryotic translation initiation factor 3 subunit M-like [Tubulanus polymorphus]|uniref:eukaryotic translation initiation factor 3 subunit M-like n=1 Tax=Tubulanus polymorphus TaxID=672921 RepID=UPI003DA28551
MSVPLFIDIEEGNQVLELRAYLKSLGAEISEENSDRGLVTDLLHVIEASNICWKELTSENELESVFNSIISLILIIPPEKSENVVVSFCEKLAKSPPGDKRATVRVKLLNNLFHGIEEKSGHRYIVYTHLLKVAGQCDLLSSVKTDLNEVKQWMKVWDVSTQKYQNLLRCLHDALQASKQTEVATKVMIELLGTYTEDNASQARDDAHRCIVTCLGDPSTFLLDHLLTLKPVRFLEGELIHDLLTIFVSGKLDQYNDFYKNNTDFVNTLGLSHEENMRKMRLLTFMQMAETQTEIDFDTIQQQMKLGEDDVEPFIIEVIATRAVRCQMDQLQRKVNISSTTHRTFGRQQWQLLKEKFTQWHEHLNIVRSHLGALTPPPV